MLTPIVLLLLSTSTSLESKAPSFDAIQRRAFDFFMDETYPATGLTKDRAKNKGPHDGNPRNMASIVCSGYMLASLAIGVERGWISKAQAYSKALTCLKYFHDKMENNHGFYYHFVDWSNGTRWETCEISSVDTALFANGALVAGEFWPKTEVQQLALDIADRIDWKWMATDGGAKPTETSPSMGWTPERGFIKDRWNFYTEACHLYLLALGNPTSKALTSAAWDAWQFKTGKVAGYNVFDGAHPIFWAQMTSPYYDLRGLEDRQGRQWWQMWVNAHLADHAYCAQHPQWRTYAAGYWGLNAMDSPDGYAADEPRDGGNSGTVSPTAMLGSLLFTPSVAEKARVNLGRTQEESLGKYGYSDAFNLDRKWYDPDVLGLDLGMMILNVENARTGLIWKLMKKSRYYKRALSGAGFHKAH